MNATQRSSGRRRPAPPPWHPASTHTERERSFSGWRRPAPTPRRRAHVYIHIYMEREGERDLLPGGGDLLRLHGVERVRPRLHLQRPIYIYIHTYRYMHMCVCVYIHTLYIYIYIYPPVYIYPPAAPCVMKSTVALSEATIAIAKHAGEIAKHPAKAAAPMHCATHWSPQSAPARLQLE
jgi:hypothetical protein